MRWHSIESASLGTLRLTQPLELAPGLNLLVAPNQAGKSTMFTMLEWLLYGVPGKGSRRNQAEVERWTPWNGAAPQASMLLAPEQAGWPELVRLDVPFGEFSPRLSDTATLADITSRLLIQANGTWNLGQLLTGLQREAYLASLYAPQGGLEAVLTAEGASLRAALTADLAELVEDPERANLDSALAQLDKPVFTLAGLQDTPVQMPTLARRAEEQYQMWRGALDSAEEKYDQLESLLAQRETAERVQAQEQDKLKRLEARSEELTLALAYYRFTEVARIEQSRREWEPRLQEQPFLADFPNLAVDIKAWQVQTREHEGALLKQQQQLEQSQVKLQDYAQILKNNEAIQPQTARRDELATQAAELDAAKRELDKAEASVREHGEVADPARRLRFEELDRQLETARAAVPEVSDWLERQQQAQRAQAEQQQLAAELKRKQGTTSGGLLVAGIVLAVAGLALALAGQRFIDPVWLAYAVGGLLVIGGIVLAVLGQQQAGQAREARVELEKAVEPKLRVVEEQLAALNTDAQHLRVRHSLDEMAWAGLVQALPEYNSLRTRLDLYAQARREADAAQARITAAWSRVREIAADTPAAAARDWLAERQKLLDKLVDYRSRQQDENAREKDLARELERLRERSGQLRDDLARLLDKLGLADTARRDPEQAIRQHDALANEARKYQAVLGLLETTAGKAQHLALSQAEYGQRWEALDPARRQALAQLVPDEPAYTEASKERREALDQLAQARQVLDRARVEAGRLRERVAREEDVLAKRTEALQQERALRQSLSRVRVWRQALENLKSALAAIQTEYAGSLAPKITEELAAVLVQAPVPGVTQVAVGPHLELRLKVAGAPVDADPRELATRLSLGAQRQLALALRIAFARALSGEGEAGFTAPLLLDEPLAELDDARSCEMLAYLGRLAQSHQVLLATCHAQQAQWLLERTGAPARVLSLPG
jgi:hypothetical protein